MKIRTIPENKLYAGTATDIVKKLFADAVFLKYRTAREYLKKFISRRFGTKIKGKTHEERCKSFLRGMFANGAAKLVS